MDHLLSSEEDQGSEINLNIEDEEESIHFMKDEINQFHVSYWMNVFNAAIFISIISAY